MTVDVSGRSIPRLSRAGIVAFADQVLAAVRAKGDLSIALVDDTTMRQLNSRFRQRKRTTDVLTFETDPPLLGEIVICIDQARRQAAEEGHSLATEIRYLIVHGVLHALGYDHETDEGEMDRLELRVRMRVGLE